MWSKKEMIYSVFLIPNVAYVQFRAAIQLQFDFHRAIYNLGTVLVSLICALHSIIWCHMLLSIKEKKMSFGDLRKGCVKEKIEKLKVEKEVCYTY